MNVITNIIKQVHEIIKKNEDNAKPNTISKLNEILNLLYSISTTEIKGEE